MTKTVRVIGIGSPVEGDRTGMTLVEQLRDDVMWQQREEIEWLVLERPGAALLQYFTGVETLCLIDALKGAGPVVRIDQNELLTQDNVISSHHIGVAESLQLAAALHLLPPRLVLYGVGDHPESYSQLSAMLSEALAPNSTAN